MLVKLMRSALRGRGILAACVAVGLLGLLVLLPNALAATGEDAGRKPKPDKLFDSSEPLTLRITAPWRDILRRKSDESRFPATLDYSPAGEAGEPIALTVERRGISRQKACKFPPIKLRFKRTAVKGTPFRGESSIKMVTHCDKGTRWEHYYIREMLAYRIYNQMTPHSFRVRPLSVTYIDSDNQSVIGPHFAFLIEDDGELAKRNKTKRSKLAEIAPGQLDSLAMSRFALFQYLIGNTDWAVLSGPSDDKCCHNSRLLDGESADALVPVPYDFDASGLVDASYAVPNQKLPIRTVTQRLYRGFCVHNGSLESARGEFLRQEQEILALVSGEWRLSERQQKRARSYLEKFFATLHSEEKFERHVTETCRK